MLAMCVVCAVHGCKSSGPCVLNARTYTCECVITYWELRDPDQNAFVSLLTPYVRYSARREEGRRESLTKTPRDSSCSHVRGPT